MNGWLLINILISRAFYELRDFIIGLFVLLFEKLVYRNLI